MTEKEYRFLSGIAVSYTDKQVWIPSESIAGDNVAQYKEIARKNNCDYILWNDAVRGVDSNYGW